MADFPLKQYAEDVQKILDSALTFNNSYPQTLSEAEKAITREKIGASAIGEGIKIISHFNTLDDLVAAITKPAVGDAYSVGTEIPYSLYVYDFLREEWRNYGPIRSIDIKARFAQNITVTSWEEDTDVFEDFTYKAQIPMGEVTGNDFPIVAFSPTDAVSGNLCPIAYCFDGYVEVWAKAIPETAITIPAITFIIQDDGASGGNTKGITNASGGIATGGVNTKQIANGAITADKVNEAARTKTFNVTVPIGWEGESAPFTRSRSVDGILATDIPKVFFSAPSDFAKVEPQLDAFSLLYDVESANGSVTFYAKEKPTEEFSVLIEVSRI